jgi:hypothetical protein
MPLSLQSRFLVFTLPNFPTFTGGPPFILYPYPLRFKDLSKMPEIAEGEFRFPSYLFILDIKPTLSPESVELTGQ